MRGLRIVLSTPDAERFRGVLTLAAAHAALGGSAAILFQADAVALLAPPIAAPRDAAHCAAGLPDLAALMEEALAAGVVLVACQSGLALCGLSAEALDPRVAVGGPMSFLQQTGDDDRLLIG